MMSSAKVPRDPDPGWKSDPRNRSRLRYWDGGAWTSRSLATAPEIAATFAAFEEGASVEPPPIRIEPRSLPAPRPRKAPDPVPLVTHPGVLLISCGLLLTLVGAFGPWTEQLIADRAFLATEPWVSGAFSAISLVCLAFYLRGRGERWKGSVTGLNGVMLVQCVLTIIEIRRFPGDHPRLDVDPTIGWGLWLTLAGVVVVTAGLLYLHFRPQPRPETV